MKPIPAFYLPLLLLSLLLCSCTHSWYVFEPSRNPNPGGAGYQWKDSLVRTWFDASSSSISAATYAAVGLVRLGAKSIVVRSFEVEVTWVEDGETMRLP